MYQSSCFATPSLIIALFLAAVPAVSQEGPKPEINIGAVWNLSSQPCNGGGGNSMSRHPDEKAIQESKAVFLKDLGFKLTVPGFPDVDRTVLKLYMGDRSRGVIDNYILICDNDLEPPFGAVVITELPEHLRTPKAAFEAVKVIESQLASTVGITPALDSIESPLGETLEMLIKDRVGTHCFPTSDFALLPGEYDVSTYGISRFTMINGYLIELSLIVAIPKGMSEAEAKAHARQSLDALCASFGPA